jgi:hypothetical protein
MLINWRNLKGKECYFGIIIVIWIKIIRNKLRKQLIKNSLFLRRMWRKKRFKKRKNNNFSIQKNIRFKKKIKFQRKISKETNLLSKIKNARKR